MELNSVAFILHAQCSVSQTTRLLWSSWHFHLLTLIEPAQVCCDLPYRTPCINELQTVRAKPHLADTNRLGSTPFPSGVSK